MDRDRWEKISEERKRDARTEKRKELGRGTRAMRRDRMR